MYGPAPFAPPQKRASANIRPARILAISNGSEELVAEATGNTLPFAGVSANAFKYAFGGFEQTAFPYHAQTGDAVTIRSPGMVGEVLSGAAVSNLGRPVGSDGSGRAISLTPAAPGATVTYALGYPLDTALIADEVIRVAIIFSTPILT